MRVIGMAFLAMVLSVGTAEAGHGRHGGRGHGGRVVYGGHGNRAVVRDHRGPRCTRAGPVRVRSGRYVFPGGVVRVYKRPVFRERYYNVHVRPPVIVETYDPVPGYVWVAGNWRWGGAEWVWVPGYWSVDAGASATFSAGITIR
jgi:hypothetical protein